MTLAYYNEFDPFAAMWLRALIARGHIAPGIVDERSIEDVTPNDLRGFTQCHFFAGIGVWSHSLHLAGWPDNRPVWTASCPCQPFSAAGKSAGFNDERHLWPSLQWLIEQCRPAIIFGEQVASKAAESWIDLVQADVEAMGYALGCVPFPSASVGAPHVRDRAYWVAHTEGEGRRWRIEVENRRPAQPRGSSHGDACWLADSERTDGQRQRPFSVPLEPEQKAGRPDYVDFWEGVEFVRCADGKARPVKPSILPLAHGTPNRVGRLRGYGNAINAEAAKTFIEAYQADER